MHTIPLTTATAAPDSFTSLRLRRCCVAGTKRAQRLWETISGALTGAPMGSLLFGRPLVGTNLSFPGVPLVGHPAFSMAAGVSIILFWTIGPDTTYALVSGLIRRSTHVCSLGYDVRANFPP